ncbi:partial Pyridoxine 5'-phosphate synthase, partial [uncultured bacterium]
EALKKFTSHLKDAGISVNLFVDPSPEAVKACHRIGSDGLELHTGAYAETKGAAREAELRRIYDSAVLSKRLGMKTHAGHGLDYGNILPVAAIREIDEFAIGYSIICRALYVGVEEAVREMKRLIKEGRGR